VRLLGLVLVADTPGKVPAPIRDLAKVVGGGAPGESHSVVGIPGALLVS